MADTNPSGLSPQEQGEPLLIKRRSRETFESEVFLLAHVAPHHSGQPSGVLPVRLTTFAPARCGDLLDIKNLLIGQAFEYFQPHRFEIKGLIRFPDANRHPEHNFDAYRMVRRKDLEELEARAGTTIKKED